MSWASLPPTLKNLNPVPLSPTPHVATENRVREAEVPTPRLPTTPPVITHELQILNGRLAQFLEDIKFHTQENEDLNAQLERGRANHKKKLEDLESYYKGEKERAAQQHRNLTSELDDLTKQHAVEQDLLREKCETKKNENDDELADLRQSMARQHFADMETDKRKLEDGVLAVEKDYNKRIADATSRGEWLAKELERLRNAQDYKLEAHINDAKDELAKIKHRQDELRSRTRAKQAQLEKRISEADQRRAKQDDMYNEGFQELHDLKVATEALRKEVDKYDKLLQSQAHRTTTPASSRKRKPEQELEASSEPCTPAPPLFDGTPLSSAKRSDSLRKNK